MSPTPLVKHKIYGSPLISLTYAIDIHSRPSNIWPWRVQVGYHRAGWYIDGWWDRIEQDLAR